MLCTEKKILISIFLIFLAVLVISLITSYKDSARVRAGIEPKYTIKIKNSDGSKITYWGLGYKVIRYISVSPNEPYKNNRGVKYGSWLMKFELKDIKKEETRKNVISGITWDEITENGVNEELLFENIDIEVLNQIGTEFQSLVEEESEAETKNPEIVITEGWGRVFKSERYKRVINLGKLAMKPLYLIVYKSPNAGAYEYLCARALYELSGYDFDWLNSKDFLKKFNEQVLNGR